MGHYWQSEVERILTCAYDVSEQYMQLKSALEAGEVDSGSRSLGTRKDIIATDVAPVAIGTNSRVRVSVILRTSDVGALSSAVKAGIGENLIGSPAAGHVARRVVRTAIRAGRLWQWLRLVCDLDENDRPVADFRVACLMIAAVYAESLTPWLAELVISELSPSTEHRAPGVRRWEWWIGYNRSAGQLGREQSDVQSVITVVAMLSESLTSLPREWRRKQARW
jgi:hypothetical protein